MARTQKDIVNYFPHDAYASAKSDTVTVLQSKYGNDGYAFWFKLLEKLATTDGHYIDLKNPARLQVFMAKMGVEKLLGVEMLNLLVEMEAIDKELWESRVIWCQNLVDNVADVYKNRRREIPTKPLTTGGNQITTPRKAITTSSQPVEKQQIKLNKTKLNNIIGEGEGETPSSPIFNIFLKKFPYAFGREPNSKENAFMRDIAKELTVAKPTEQQIHDAFAEAVGQNKMNLSYVKAILKDWLGIPR